jgi:hypothetical protein
MFGSHTYNTHLSSSFSAPARCLPGTYVGDGRCIKKWHSPFTYRDPNVTSGGPALVAEGTASVGPELGLSKGQITEALEPGSGTGMLF